MNNPFILMASSILLLLIIIIQGLLACFMITSLTCASASDEPLLIRQVRGSDKHAILDLPGAPSVSFAQYSGYLTVDEQTGRSLFYWFVEADLPDPSSAPVTLWLNGGPGCSSVGGGMLSELGPFYPTKDGVHLQVNPHSWNKVSNLIFLESPAGVGFSYSNFTEDYVTNDAKTAEDSYVFLQRFWELYPEFSENPFYIAGESYAGHYVPQLAALILQRGKLEDSSVNFKGIAVGNPLTDPAIDSYGAAFYWWTHALISDATFQGIVNSCNLSSIGPLQSGEYSKCDQYVDAARQAMASINIYDIYVDICVSAQAHSQAVHFIRKLNRNQKSAFGALPLLSDSYDPCIDNEVELYLNRPEVQVALHANVTDLPYRWSDCSDIVDYSNEDLLTSILPLYQTLLQSGLQILVFSGDVDAILPVTGTRSWVSNLSLDVRKAWRPWFIHNQVGGYVTQYDGLLYATIREAGHMVPYTQPARALHLFESFVNNIPL
ncbi:hypothetical protein O6H91_07G043400 [Diphasiastrum complanatum]|uniref:Uncharacterized protein n=1 Tax=Diphasiastrum complanatum TaxID=34168 RepID=A0ACC2D5B5_DIPCM|nr:hypothetical protein O6H91_07G043400 [Diphasiastrum complanatum]